MKKFFKNVGEFFGFVCKKAKSKELNGLIEIRLNNFCEIQQSKDKTLTNSYQKT